MALATRSRPKAHHRKRHAGHHRHSRHYLKPYWPYLPMLLIVGLGLLVNSVWSGAGVLGTNSDFSASKLLNDTNAERAKDGEPALSFNVKLEEAAQAKADDMVRSDYWSHNSPSGRTPWSFITASNYQYRSAGENLAYGFDGADASVAGWMNSAEHRANILNVSYSDVGFGVASSADFIGHGPQTIVVAEYGQPMISDSSSVAAGSASGASRASGTTGASGAPAAASSNVLGADAAQQPVSRIQILTGDRQAWSLLAIIALTGAAGALFILRYSYRFHRVLVRGEKFVTRHPYLDIFAVLIITVGCVLTRVSGIVR